MSGSTGCLGVCVLCTDDNGPYATMVKLRLPPPALRSRPRRVTTGERLRTGARPLQGVSISLPDPGDCCASVEQFFESRSNLRGTKSSSHGGPAHPWMVHSRASCRPFGRAPERLWVQARPGRRSPVTARPASRMGRRLRAAARAVASANLGVRQWFRKSQARRPWAAAVTMKRRSASSTCSQTSM